MNIAKFGSLICASVGGFGVWKFMPGSDDGIARIVFEFPFVGSLYMCGFGIFMYGVSDQLGKLKGD